MKKPKNFLKPISMPLVLFDILFFHVIFMIEPISFQILVMKGLQTFLVHFCDVY